MIELCDEQLGIGPCSICERNRRMSGKPKCICVAGYKISCPIHGLKPMEEKSDREEFEKFSHINPTERREISLKEGIEFLRKSGMRVIVVGEDVVDAGVEINPSPRTIAALALTYIAYVKERFPQVHAEADGSPSIEWMIRKYLDEAQTPT